MTAFLHMSAISEGLLVKVDEGFDCANPRQVYRVMSDPKHPGDNKLYIICEQGRHYLGGQSSWEFPDSDRTKPEICVGLTVASEVEQLKYALTYLLDTYWQPDGQPPPWFIALAAQLSDYEKPL